MRLNLKTSANGSKSHENRDPPHRRHRLACHRRRRPRSLYRRHQIPDHGQGLVGRAAARDRPRRRRHPALHEPRARLRHQHPVRLRQHRSEADGRARQAARADRRRHGEGEPGPHHAPRPARRRRGGGWRDRRAEGEIRGPARIHRKGVDRAGRHTPRRRQQDRRRQRRIQCRRHPPARRAGAAARRARRCGLPAGELRQRRLDAARHRRPQRQHAQEPGGGETRGDRRRKAGIEPLQRPHRTDPLHAAGVAQKSGDARQRHRRARQAAVRLCRALRRRGRASCRAGPSAH